MRNSWLPKQVLRIVPTGSEDARNFLYDGDFFCYCHYIFEGPFDLSSKQSMSALSVDLFPVSKPDISFCRFVVTCLIIFENFSIVWISGIIYSFSKAVLLSNIDRNF